MTQMAKPICHFPIPGPIISCLMWWSVVFFSIKWFASILRSPRVSWSNCESNCHFCKPYTAYTGDYCHICPTPTINVRSINVIMHECLFCWLSVWFSQVQPKPGVINSVGGLTLGKGAVQIQVLGANLAQISAPQAQPTLQTQVNFTRS